MHTFKKLAFAMSLAIFSLALLAAGASASRGIIFELPGGVRGPIRASAEQSVFIGPIGFLLTCRLTLHGELTTLLIAKNSPGRLPEGQMGKVTEGRANRRCEDNMTRERGDNLIFLAEAVAPTLLRYDGYLGSLPAILGIQVTLLRVEFLLDIPLIARCLYVGNIRAILRDRNGVSRINTMLFDDTSVVLLAPRQFFGCASSITPLGMFTLSPEITLRLQA